MNWRRSIFGGGSNSERRRRVKGVWGEGVELYLYSGLMDGWMVVICFVADGMVFIACVQCSQGELLFYV
jgi:hypothetical protein